jgi:Ni,Fe-hydrogenase III small subunit
MSQWVIKGLRTGIKSTRYPYAPEDAAGTSPGLPKATRMLPHLADLVINCCPTKALLPASFGVGVDLRRCVDCFRCVRRTDAPMNWNHGYECAAAPGAETARCFTPQFRRSAHILVVDAGDCGACLSEVKQLNSPYYNMHRLGFFFTPTPRHADLLLVVGTLTEHMRLPLRKAYEAMPTPKLVVAAGTCALSGGVFGKSFICEGGVGDVLRVDVEVPGNPPPPLAILHGLLVAVGRKPSDSLQSGVEEIDEPKA